MCRSRGVLEMKQAVQECDAQREGTWTRINAKKKVGVVEEV